LQNGASYIERADKLVQLIAAQKGLRHPVIDANVALVDARLEANRNEGGSVSAAQVVSVRAIGSVVPARVRAWLLHLDIFPEAEAVCDLRHLGRGASYNQAARLWRLPSTTTS
jgi:hypothetical protein